MSLHKHRLTLTHKRSAVAVAKDVEGTLDLSDLVTAKAAIKQDPRVRAVNPALVSAFVEVVLAIVTYIRKRSKEKNGTEALQTETVDQTYLASIRYQK